MPPVPEYVIATGRGLEKRNEQLRRCEESRQPLVLIEPRLKYATIVVDMVSIRDCSLTRDGQRKLEALFRDHDGEGISVCEFYAKVNRILLLDAEHVAQKAFGIAMASQRSRGAA